MTNSILARPFDFIGGITVNFNWKGLDFSIAGNYQIGGKVYVRCTLA